MIDIYNYNLYPSHASFALSIDENKKNLFLFVNSSEEVIGEFGKQIAGINYLKEAYINYQILFDNKGYFDSRIYLDSEINYFKTLDEKVITNELLSHFGKAVNEEKLKQLIHTFSIRSYYKNNKINGIGNNLFLFSLALSSLNNAIIKINDCEVLENKELASKINEFEFGLIVLSKYKDGNLKLDNLNCYDFIYVIYKDKVKKLTRTEALNYNVEVENE